MTVTTRPYRGDMTGTCWEVDIRFEWADGSVFRERKRTPCTSKSAAQRWGENRKRELVTRGKEEVEAKDRGEVPTLSTFWNRYLTDHCEASGHAKSTITLKTIEFNAYLKPTLGDVRLDGITEALVDKLKATLAHLAAKTVNNALGLLANMLNKAVAWGVVDELPCGITKRKQAHQEMEFHSFEEFTKLEQAAKELDRRIHIFVLLGGRAGLRRGEIIGLRWQNVSFERSVIRVVESDYQGELKPPKNGRTREVPMTEELRQALLAFSKHKGPRVLLRDDGSPLTGDAVRSWMKRAEKRAGLDGKGKTHRLRHTLLSHLALKGAPLRTIQEVAGHHALSMTARYLHLTPTAKADAMKLLDRGVDDDVKVD